MTLLICGAKTKQGMPCNRLAIAPSKRCHYHGALSTGCRTPTGRLANGARLKLVRVNGAPPGHRKTHKAKRKREAAVVRLKAWRDREPIRRKKALKWANRQRVKSGLPLLTDAELDSFVADTET